MKKIVVILVLLIGYLSMFSQNLTRVVEQVQFSYPKKWNMQVLEPEVNIFYTKNIVEFKYKNASVKVSWFDNPYDLSLDFGIELYKKKLQEQGISYRLLLLDSLKNFRKYSKVEYTGIQQKKYQSLEFYQEDAKIFIIEQSEIPQNDQMFWKDKNNFIFILPKEETIEKQDVEPTEIAETTIVEPISVEEPSKETESEKEDSLQIKTDNELLVKTEEVADVVDVTENNPETDICDEDTSTIPSPKENPFAETIEEKPILEYFQDTLPPTVEVKEEEEETIPTIAITEENIVTIEPQEEPSITYIDIIEEEDSFLKYFTTIDSNEEEETIPTIEPQEEPSLTVVAEKIEEEPILEYSQDTIPSIVEVKEEEEETIPTIAITEENIVTIEPIKEPSIIFVAEKIEEEPILEYSQDTVPSIVETIDVVEPIPTMDTTGESIVKVEPQEELNFTEVDNAEAESQKSEEVAGKIGLCSNVTYFYPIDWELVSQRNVTPNTWEVILQSGKEEYIIIQEDASFTEQSLLEKENLMVNNIKGIVFDTKIDSLQQDQHRFFYKKFYLNRLCGALVLEQSESDAFLVTIQSFDTVDLTSSSYNYILNHLNENKPKAGSHRTEVGDISFVLPSGYMVSDTIVEKEQTYFKILSPELGTASILFHVYDKDCNLVRLLNLHQMQQKNMFTAFEKIAVSKTAEVMMLYYTSSNEMATYGVTVCMRYKGKTFLIDVFTNALNDTFFDSNHLMNLLNSIDVKS
ncbi:MAG: hypothetical protein IKS33_00930 [Bacteroidales bacterium]|nr:hypothetical protein [Bacteroidales bacterium]